MFQNPEGGGYPERYGRTNEKQRRTLNLVSNKDLVYMVYISHEPCTKAITVFFVLFLMLLYIQMIDKIEKILITLIILLKLLISGLPAFNQSFATKTQKKTYII